LGAQAIWAHKNDCGAAALPIEAGHRIGTGTPKQVGDVARLPSAEVEAFLLNRTGRYCAVNRPYHGNREASGFAPKPTPDRRDTKIVLR
jgi:hypothetical protein